MMTFPRWDKAASGLPARVLGIGNAGVHLADRVAMSIPSGAEVVAVNTDAQSLASSIASRKAVLGQRLTRGLGCGGDPELGAEAAHESIEEIRFAVEGAPLVILLAGLGGGTGSGAAPVAATAAREAGAYVLALATMPFEFEGRRRAAQAAQALEALTREAHAVLRFDNDRMADLTSPRAGIGETFQASDALLSEAVLAFLDMVAARGPMPVHFGNLAASLAGGTQPAVFGRGEATGDNRAHEALERALRSPLLDRGRMLESCRAIVAALTGPPSLSFAETSAIMMELGRHVPPEAAMSFGVSLTDNPAAPVGVTIFGVCGAAEQAVRRAAYGQIAARPAESHPAPSPTAEAPPPAPAPLKDSLPEPEAVPERPQPPGRLIADEPPDFKPPPSRKPAKPPPAPRARQETLPFEPADRGRFQKVEPTIVEGEDLDIPTYLRLGRLK